MRVLVVDDEKNIRATLALCLEEAGCEVEAVAAGGAALAALERTALRRRVPRPAARRRRAAST